MNERQKTNPKPSKVGSAAAISGLLGLGAYGLATQFVPEPYAGLALWLILPAYALSYWWIVPPVRRRYGLPFRRQATRQETRPTYYSVPNPDLVQPK